ncbi:outer membrane beta-barrel protein [Helicobacter pylori]|nr:outer membrane beta-barrel protein [Helicobacter pylori]
MKKSFKKLGFVSLATSSVLLGSMNATDLQTYAALQKPSHVFGNYAEKESGSTNGSGKDGKSGSSGTGTQHTASSGTPTPSTPPTKKDESGSGSGTSGTQHTASSGTPTPSTPPTKKDESGSSGTGTQHTASSGTPTPSTPPAKKDESGSGSGTSGTQHTASSGGTPTPQTPPAKKDESGSSGTGTQHTASSGTPTPSTPPAKKDESGSGSGTSGTQHTASSGGTPTPQTPPAKKDESGSSGTGTQHTASSGTPTPQTPPAKTEPSSTGNSVASQLVKDTTTVNSLKSVSVSSMNTTLSGVETMSQQSATIGNLLNSSTDLSSVIPNAQGLSSAFSALESAQNTLKGYLDSSSATIGQLTNGSNAVVGALDKAINQVDMALADLVTTDTQKTQAVTLAATGSSTNSTTTDAIAFLNALKSNLMAQKDAFMNVHKNIQTAVAQAQATYTPSVINTNNYGQMYGVDAMAGYKWFFGKTKRFGFRTYGYYSYNHANLSFVGSKLGIMEGASQVNNFTYGVGFDALYNFYESKEGYNTAGLFLGFGLGGDSFIVQGESYLKSQMQICNNTAGCSASMNTSYFQMPVQFGFRSNFSKHSGIEVGFKLPLFTNQFYKERGVDGSVDVFYKRNFSIYFNYMINF